MAFLFLSVTLIFESYLWNQERGSRIIDEEIRKLGMETSWFLESECEKLESLKSGTGKDKIWGEQKYLMSM